MSDLSWKVKGQPLPLQIIYSYVISNKYNDFGFNSFQKIYYLKIFPFKCATKQFWPWH